MGLGRAELHHELHDGPFRVIRIREPICDQMMHSGRRHQQALPGRLLHSHSVSAAMVECSLQPCFPGSHTLALAVPLAHLDWHSWPPQVRLRPPERHTLPQPATAPTPHFQRLVKCAPSALWRSATALDPTPHLQHSVKSARSVLLSAMPWRGCSVWKMMTVLVGRRKKARPSSATQHL